MADRIIGELFQTSFSIVLLMFHPFRSSIHFRDQLTG
jgi:hypothetical protein